jgi:starch synthase
VDEQIWSPETDLLLARAMARDSVEDKAENKRQLQIAMGLKVNDKVPLFAVVSRLTSQKGLDLVLEALPVCWSRAGSWRCSARATRCCRKVSSPPRRNIRAGGRADWLPRGVFAPHYGRRGRHSGAEPFRTLRPDAAYGLKYGTLPLVRRTGGLADTVSDSSLENLADGIASGFVFEDSNAWSLLRAIRRAFVLWSRPSLWRFSVRR